MKVGSIDVKSFIIGALSILLIGSVLGVGSDFFTPDEAARLKNFANCIQGDGSINLGNKRIIMLGSSIYDDGSEGGGLILRGGANKIHFHGDTILDGNVISERPVIGIGADLDMGNHKFIMLGSSIYDNGSEGGGLILRGGANKIHFHGDSILDGNILPERETIGIGANLDMGRHKFIMQGSSIYDDGSESGGLILRGGANRIHFFGQTVQH